MRFILAVTLALAAALAQAQTGSRFSFAIVGDAPYNFFEEPVFVQMLKDIGKEDVAFVVHVGDFKSGSSPCSNEMFEDRKRMFQASRHPFIYVPGDNDWTDCHRRGAGGFDPLERLAKLRGMFYADDDSLGVGKLNLEHQSADPRFAEFRENLRWTFEGVLFIALNIPGSNNNLGRTREMDAEHERRSLANAAWLAQGFDLAGKKASAAVFVVIQANPDFEMSFILKRNKADGYAKFKKELLAHTLAFSGKVVLVHGDTHRFQVDQPMVDPVTSKPVEHFTRIESFGSPYVDWVKVSIDPADQKLFSIQTGRQMGPER